MHRLAAQQSHQIGRLQNQMDTLIAAQNPNTGQYHQMPHHAIMQMPPAYNTLQAYQLHPSQMPAHMWGTTPQQRSEPHTDLPLHAWAQPGTGTPASYPHAGLQQQPRWRSGKKSRRAARERDAQQARHPASSVPAPPPANAADELSTEDRGAASAEDCTLTDPQTDDEPCAPATHVTAADGRKNGDKPAESGIGRTASEVSKTQVMDAAGSAVATCSHDAGANKVVDLTAEEERPTCKAITKKDQQHNDPTAQAQLPNSQGPRSCPQHFLGSRHAPKGRLKGQRAPRGRGTAFQHQLAQQRGLVAIAQPPYQPYQMPTGQYLPCSVIGSQHPRMSQGNLHHMMLQGPAMAARTGMPPAPYLHPSYMARVAEFPYAWPHTT